MRFRKLRIAWSVFWGLACVLLIVLWVRSYWWSDTFDYPARRSVVIIFNSGALQFGTLYSDPQLLGPNINKWRHFTYANPDKWDHSFDWEWTDSDIAIQFPIWLLMVVIGGVATLPWLRWRFTIRTLLIATTLVAVLLGFVIYAARG
jgi:hypothetical protein